MANKAFRQAGDRDTPQGGAPAAGRGLKGKLQGKNGAIIAAGATVGVIALLTLLRGKSAAPAAADATTQNSSFDSSAYDLAEQWQQQFEGLQGQINQLQSQPPGSTNTNPAPPASNIPKPVPLPAPIAKPPVAKPPVRVTPHPVAKPPPKTVTVKRGDTLSAIAARAHISMATLKKLNPVYWTNAKYKNGNSIWAGDKVRVA